MNLKSFYGFYFLKASFSLLTITARGYQISIAYYLFSLLSVWLVWRYTHIPYFVFHPITSDSLTLDSVLLFLHAVDSHQFPHGDFITESYENTPVQHTAIFHGCKNDNIQLNVFDYFHIFAQKIDRGYTLLTRTHNLCFRAKIRKKCIPL